MMTYTMARQGGYGVEDFIKTAVDCKLEGIDWITTYGRDPKELKMMSDDAGLEVACHTFFLSKFINRETDWLDDAKKSIDDAVALGAPVVMIPTCPRPDTNDRTMYRKEWIEALAQVAPLADAAGIILTVENFPGLNSPFITAADFLEAKNAVPQLKLTYDNGNASSGENPVESFKKCASDVVHVHFKDWDIVDQPTEGYREMLDGRYYSPALIGEGDVDTVGCWNALRDAGYDGFINIEYENSKYPADEAIRKVADYLRSL
jgi:sugar phosphate isomerase/epimerase